MPRGRHRSLAVVVILSLAASCSGDDGTTAGRPGGPEEPRYRADIRRTEFGIPHITAEDWGSLGFGQGYVFAQDHLCTLADQIVKVRSERSRFFGRGDDDANLNSDLAYLALGIRERGERDLRQQPRDVIDVVTGYAAGYNAYLAETTRQAVPGWCRGEPWVRPISPVDLFTYYRDLALFASGGNLIEPIATAQPPGPGQPAPGATPAATGRSDLRPVTADLGSNGWALGRDRTSTERGMVVANPHFPWRGERRLWESHLTIPDQVDVYGAALLGTPGVQIGFNRSVGWTHTVADGDRFTAYRLSLDPGDPTRYRYGGQVLDLTPTEHRVAVRGGGGTVEMVERTLWRSRYGPVLNLPVLGWSAETAYTYRDANIDNDELLAQFLGMARADSLDAFQRVFEEVGGIPWVNTMAADAEGRVWYADAAATPNLAADAIDRWRTSLDTDPIARLLDDDFGVVLLDGSDPRNEWREVPGARDPGLVPFRDQPQMERDDYVANANDSHWIANPSAPLEGFTPLQGEERSALSVRSRRNFEVLEADASFDAGELRRAVLGNQSLTSDLLREAIVDRCRAAGGPVDLAPACDALDRWDGRFDLRSRGAVLWRELLAGFEDEDLVGAGPLFAEDFDPDQPLTTPGQLAPPPADGADPVLAGLADAVETLAGAGLEPDAALGDVQYFVAPGGDRVPIHGGQGRDGVLNVVATGDRTAGSTLMPYDRPGDDIPDRTDRSGITTAGYPVATGTSFVMVLAYTDDGPEAQALLTYAESGDPASPHAVDQTRRFSRKQWRPIRFTDAQIESDRSLQEFTLEGG